MHTSRGEAKRGGERIPSSLHTVSTSPTWDLIPWTVRSWPEPKSRVGRLTDWATQAPLMTKVLLDSSKWPFPKNSYLFKVLETLLPNSLQAYAIPKYLPTWKCIISHLSQPQCSSSCSQVLFPCFKKKHLLAPKMSQKLFLNHSLQTPTFPHQLWKTICQQIRQLRRNG